MSAFDDNPIFSPGQPEPAEPSVSEPASGEPSIQLTGDAFFTAEAPPAALPVAPILPEDLRISWSWPHFLIFILFGALSQVVIAIVVIAYYSAGRHFTQDQIMKFVASDPKILVGINVLWFALIMLFLYITLGVLRGLPFWLALGWRKLNSGGYAGRGRPWMYFLTGCGLAIFVAFAGSQVKTNDHLPIQDLFKSRTGAFLLMAMAVFVAPLVEETVFRGYLYPFFAGKISRFAEIFGIDSVRAIRVGTVTGIFITGILFGLLHGSQLGWTWGLVSLLTLVGVIFTFARAWTGTVLASFLLHLGYNSMLAATSIIATRGFSQMPPGN